MATRSPKQKDFIAARASGLSRAKSAIVAGVSVSELSGPVQAALGKEFAKNAKYAKITREDVIDGLMDAANMGKIAADPMAMIAAYRELGKLCGFYAPEVKKIEHELGAETIHALENLSDQELLRISRGRVIDGTAKDITDATPA